MAFTYDPTTSRGRVRLLCTDTNSTYQIFSDAEIDTFLDLEDDNVRLAAAMALETIASSTALVDKKMKSADLQTDGPAVAKELRERAAQLRAKVDEEVSFDWAEQSLSTANAVEIVWNDALRSS